MPPIRRIWNARHGPLAARAGTRGPRTIASRGLLKCTALTLPLLMALLLTTGTPTAHADHRTDGDAAIRHQGNGTWVAPADGAVHAATATWLTLGGNITAFTVQTDQGRWSCFADPGDAEGEGRNGTASTCSGETRDDSTELSHGSADGPFVGTFRSMHHTVLLEAEDADPPPLLPGFILSALAVVSLIASLVLAFLYIQERRVAHYLVRRLYEETKGRIPPDWPESLRHQWIARVFVRGKN